VPSGEATVRTARRPIGLPKGPALEPTRPHVQWKQRPCDGEALCPIRHMRREERCHGSELAVRTAVIGPVVRKVAVQDQCLVILELDVPEDTRGR